jgi:hypothetical protein
MTMKAGLVFQGYVSLCSSSQLDSIFLELKLLFSPVLKMRCLEISVMGIFEKLPCLCSLNLLPSVNWMSVLSSV